MDVGEYERIRVPRRVTSASQDRGAYALYVMERIGDSQARRSGIARLVPSRVLSRRVRLSSDEAKQPHRTYLSDRDPGRLANRVPD